MFTKACLVSIVALLAAMLITQRSQEVVRAQTRIEYKAVETESASDKYYGTQDALNDYSKNGWVLVTASYDHLKDGTRAGLLIFMRK